MSEAAADERAAARPREFSRADWRAILGRVWTGFSDDGMTLIAAGVAFYAMLAIFPMIGALVAVYGLLANPSDATAHMSALEDIVPAGAFDLIEAQVNKVAGAGQTTLGFASALSIALALWTSKAGVSALIMGLNIVYGEKEQRSLLRTYALSLALTLFLIVVMAVTLAAIVAIPVVLNVLALGPWAEWLAAILRWPIGLAAVVLGLGTLYRWGVSRRPPRSTWLARGTLAATVLWLIASILFSIYVANFASYNETYGSLGAVIALMMWFWISALVVLIGAKVNAEMEHQTSHDTTTGKTRPIGERGAFVADNVARGR